MALWAVHHWADTGAGIAELRRVARTVAIVAASDVLNQLRLSSATTFRLSAGGVLRFSPAAWPPVSAAM